MNRFKASKFRHTEARVPRREVSAAGPAGPVGSRGRRGRGCRRAGTGTGTGTGQDPPRPAAPPGRGSGPRSCGIADVAGPCPGSPAAGRVRLPGGPSSAPGAAHPGVRGGSRPRGLRRWGWRGTPALSCTGSGWRGVPVPWWLLPSCRWARLAQAVHPRLLLPAAVRCLTLLCQPGNHAPSVKCWASLLPPRSATPLPQAQRKCWAPGDAAELHHPGHEPWSSAPLGPGSSGGLAGQHRAMQCPSSMNNQP